MADNKQCERTTNHMAHNWDEDVSTASQSRTVYHFCRGQKTPARVIGSDENFVDVKIGQDGRVSLYNHDITGLFPGIFRFGLYSPPVHLPPEQRAPSAGTNQFLRGPRNHQIERSHLASEEWMAKAYQAEDQQKWLQATYYMTQAAFWLEREFQADFDARRKGRRTVGLEPGIVIPDGE